MASAVAEIIYETKITIKRSIQTEGLGVQLNFNLNPVFFRSKTGLFLVGRWRSHPQDSAYRLGVSLEIELIGSQRKQLASTRN